jgi:hypothetical protein
MSIDPEDLAALARHALGHATPKDHGRILRMAGEGEAKDWEPPYVPLEPPPVSAELRAKLDARFAAKRAARDEPKLPKETWEAVNPPRAGTCW